MSIEILQPFRPCLSAQAFDGGGREVIGWFHCPRWKALLSWAQLLLERNVYGCLPFSTNPEPWPGYYDGIEAAEISHLNSPWYWNEVAEWIALATLANTLEVYRCPKCSSTAITRKDKGLEEIAGIPPLCLNCGWSGHSRNLVADSVVETISPNP